MGFHALELKKDRTYSMYKAFLVFLMLLNCRTLDKAANLQAEGDQTYFIEIVDVTIDFTKWIKSIEGNTQLVGNELIKWSEDTDKKKVFKLFYNPITGNSRYYSCESEKKDCSNKGGGLTNFSEIKDPDWQRTMGVYASVTTDSLCEMFEGKVGRDLDDQECIEYIKERKNLANSSERNTRGHNTGFYTPFLTDSLACGDFSSIENCIFSEWSSPIPASNNNVSGPMTQFEVLNAKISVNFGDIGPNHSGNWHLLQFSLIDMNELNEATKAQIRALTKGKFKTVEFSSGDLIKELGYQQLFKKVKLRVISI